MGDVVLGQLTLKIKFASLVEEAKYIRRLERRIKRHRARARTDEQRSEFSSHVSSLQGHRRVEIRREARSTHLARMVVKGTEYKMVEQKCHTKPNWERVATLLASHLKDDIRVTRQRVAEWIGVELSLTKATA